MDNDDRVQNAADLPTHPRDGGEQRGDEERHVVGDDLDDQAAVGRGRDPHQGLTRTTPLRHGQVRPRGLLQLKPSG